MRPTYAEIDLGAIGHNVAAFQELVAPSELCVVVKADAYGHGDAPVAEAAIDAGAGWLAVALLEEGIRLREAEIEAPILVLSEPDPSDAIEVAKWGLTPTVYSQAFVEALGETGVGFDLHVKIDTGMHRVGVGPAQLDGLMAAVAASPILEVAALWSHFPVADEDSEYTMRQIERFDEVVSGYDVPMVHLANTAGAVLFPDARRSLVRVGLGTYGLHPCEETRHLIDLSPAMRIVSHVSHVQRLEAGARPSYGRIRPLAAASTVATVPIGYADGFPRRLSAEGHVLIGGEERPLAGTVTMDQIVVDVGDADVGIGDEVVLMGRQGDAEVTADDWARALHTISYEVVCEIGPRVPKEVCRVNDTITAITGVEVGHWSDPDAGTGCTVVVFPEPNVASAEVRGAAPGSRETALLEHGMRVEQIQAILLTGGSAFGLAAADGVVRALEADGRGHLTPVARVPIVPAAVVFDLNPASGGVRPGPDQGEAAYRAVTSDPVVSGRFGVGTGTTVAKWRGFEHMRPGGLGSALRPAADAKVGALVALNAVGDVFSITGEPLTGGNHEPGPPAPFPETIANTTLVVIATDAAMTRSTLSRLAVRAHDAMAVCIRPVHTRFDGDIVFAVSCGEIEADVETLAEAAFGATAAAIERAVRASAG